MIDKKFRELSSELESTKRKRNMLDGELIPLTKELNSLGINSIEEAEKERDQLISKKDRIINRVQELMNEFEKEFGGSLDI